MAIKWQEYGKYYLTCGSGDRMAAVLDLSFNGLHPSSQEIFLDIAGVCANKSRRSLVAAWTRIYGPAAKIHFKSIVDAALISEVDGLVRIHDVLQDLGREKIRTKYQKTRIWTEDYLQGSLLVGYLHILTMQS